MNDRNLDSVLTEKERLSAKDRPESVVDTEEYLANIKNKPDLVLTEENLLEGAKNPSVDFSLKLQKDLIAVLEYMLDHEDILKIDLGWEERCCKLCGTYRDILGWWAYWLEIPIHIIEPDVRPQEYEITNRFRNTLRNKNIWQRFQLKQDVISPNNDMFFSEYGSLEVRIKRAKALKL